MQVNLDESLLPNSTAVRYGGFWARFGALIVDGLVLAPVTFGVTYFNIISWKSTPLMVIVALLQIAYKPWMEATYGATLGKMVVRLQVVDLSFGKADLKAVLLRNIFNIIPTLITLIFSIQMYADPEFQDITGYMEFATFSQQYSSNQFASMLTFLLALIDAIMLATDEQKRSLHDRIGGTYVIEKP